ncbi:MAG TPA: calcium-binding protein [Allosphingosinicella sp.]|jgi:Ca2+-binding RTX toxin-like protein
MATGTEGNDNLTNDPSIRHDKIEALGGDDIITVQKPNSTANSGESVEVNGGIGSDTLIFNLPGQRIQSLSGSGFDGHAILRDGLGIFQDLVWTSIERLEITAALFSGSPNQQFSTGDSIDILRFGTPNSQRGNGGLTLSTNGGNDEVYISGEPVAAGTGGITVNAGTGDDLVDFRAVAMSGGLGWTANGGDGQDRLIGSVFRDVLRGDAGNDTLQLWIRDPASGTDARQGGTDVAEGGSGNDNFFFGAALGSGDVVTGGADTDTLVLQGEYAGGLTLSANVTEIENVSILGGDNTAFGEPGTNRHDYVLTTSDVNFAAGVQARINGAALQPDEDFTFNGSAETNASFVVYGGKGKDSLLGGLGNDIFFFAEERFASGDTVNGGAGYDGMFLRGNYTIDFNAPGYAGLFTNIENLTLTSATDERYARGGGTEFDYNITLSDAIVGAGQQLTVSGALLMASETMIVDAGQESNGSLRLFGGKAADTLKGGGQADLLHGGLGADTLAGNGGADVFRYQNVAESNNASLDHILDFTAGADKIDLSRIDANSQAGGDQAFTWIGSNGFSGTAGELRAENLNNAGWFIEGDTDGNGSADFVIMLTLAGPTPLSAGDFFL